MAMESVSASSYQETVTPSFLLVSSVRRRPIADALLAFVRVNSDVALPLVLMEHTARLPIRVPFLVLEIRLLISDPLGRCIRVGRRAFFISRSIKRQ